MQPSRPTGCHQRHLPRVPSWLDGDRFDCVAEVLLEEPQNTDRRRLGVETERITDLANNGRPERGERGEPRD